MSSFDDFYKKWKEENNITTQSNYNSNISNEERANIANNYLSNSFNNIRNIKPRNNYIDTINTSNNNNNSLWNNIMNIANNFTNNKSNNMLLFGNKQESELKKVDTQNLSLFNKDNKKVEVSEETIKNLASLNEKDRANQIKTLAKTKEEQGQLTLKVNEYIENQKSAEKANQINKDLSEGNILSSVGQILKGIPQGALDATMTTATAIESFNPLNPNADSQLEASKILTSQYQNTTQQIDNGVVKTASNVSNTIGNMVPSILANIMAPGSGKFVQAINVGASGYSDTLNEDKTNKLQSVLTGVAKGGTSYAIEGLFGGNFFGGGSLDDIARRTISSNVSSNIGKRIASKIYEIGRRSNRRKFRESSRICNRQNNK